MKTTLSSTENSQSVNWNDTHPRSILSGISINWRPHNVQCMFIMLIIILIRTVSLIFFFIIIIKSFSPRSLINVLEETKRRYKSTWAYILFEFRNLCHSICLILFWLCFCFCFCFWFLFYFVLFCLSNNRLKHELKTDEFVLKCYSINLFLLDCAEYSLK